MNKLLISLLLKPLCKIGIHNYEITQRVDNKGKHLCFRRSCDRCEKEQELKRPTKYHPCKWVWVSLLLIVLVGCSTERKCRKAINRAKALGCLTTDSIVLKDTFIMSSLDTIVKFTTINEVDTLIVDNVGVKTVVFTKWKTREVRVVQTGDTVIKEIKVPQMVIKQTDCPKVKWWDNYINNFMVALIAILIYRFINKNN
jgi:hypothetical protein